MLFRSSGQIPQAIIKIVVYNRTQLCSNFHSRYSVATFCRWSPSLSEVRLRHSDSRALPLTRQEWRCTRTARTLFILVERAVCCSPSSTRLRCSSRGHGPAHALTQWAGDLLRRTRRDPIALCLIARRSRTSEPVCLKIVPQQRGVDQGRPTPSGTCRGRQVKALGYFPRKPAGAV